MSLYIYQELQHKENRNVNNRLWIITMCQCRFIGCKKCIAVLQISLIGESACVGQGTQAMHFLFKLTINLKFLLKKYSIKNNLETIFVIFENFINMLKMTCVIKKKSILPSYKFTSSSPWRDPPKHLVSQPTCSQPLSPSVPIPPHSFFFFFFSLYLSLFSPPASSPCKQQRHIQIT